MTLRPERGKRIPRIPKVPKGGYRITIRSLVWHGKWHLIDSKNKWWSKEGGATQHVWLKKEGTNWVAYHVKDFDETNKREIARAKSINEIIPEMAIWFDANR